MMSRDRIISTCLLKLGEVTSYNDDRSEIYRIANALLENVIDNIATRNDFLFNATTVYLTVYGRREDTEEVIYNLPSDFLNKVSFVGGLGRIENEFVYSEVEDLQMRYCKKIDFTEIPNYMFNYLVYALATEVSETYQQYVDRLQFLNSRLEQERLNVYKIEFSPKLRVIE